MTGEVSTLPTPGHTPGHTSFLISSQGERAIITGDAIHSRAQTQETHWSPRADSKPDISAESRKNLLERIENDNAMLISGHFPAPGFGTLVRMEGRRYWQADLAKTLARNDASSGICPVNQLRQSIYLTLQP